MHEVTTTAQVLHCWLERSVFGRDYRFLDCNHDGPSQELRRRSEMGGRHAEDAGRRGCKVLVVLDSSEPSG